MTRSQKRTSIGWTTALLLGMGLGAASAHAADVRGNNKHQGTAGDQCTSASDCQKPLRCIPEGKQKLCTRVPIAVPT